MAFLIFRKLSSNSSYAVASLNVASDQAHHLDYMNKFCYSFKHKYCCHDHGSSQITIRTKASVL